MKAKKSYYDVIGGIFRKKLTHKNERYWWITL